MEVEALHYERNFLFPQRYYTRGPHADDVLFNILVVLLTTPFNLVFTLNIFTGDTFSHLRR